MLNRAPYNTEVPEFSPARDAPINSYVIRKYPCQEQLAGMVNHFRSLTWKIQQPDSSMVWQSVKLVLPMAIQCYDDAGNVANMNVYDRRPTCNLALSQSPMNAFEQTTLSLNGRIFSEVNAYRDVLDACYRGIGAQAYGDNHSLKPIVQRNIFNGRLPANDQLPLFKPDGTTTGHFVQTTDLEERTVDSAFSLLEHNGPFIERARIFQDQLSYDGKTWTGEISHLLEIGPFQARARKGNTAVPYIKDFHLRMNFSNNPSRFDTVNPPKTTGGYHELGGRTMATKLLEFATMPKFLHHGEHVLSTSGWPCDFSFTYTKKPYLEVVYTKHEGGMRPFYNLRCFEHQYEQSQRFLLDAPYKNMESPTSLQRVTTRLLSLPTKVYVWADLAEEYKHSFISGGVRRSCRLENLHLRVNQRPDVMFNPSQEECYEMFRRHTNSSLEYGSWLKSPIYCFDMVDIGQSDMYSNDARITWMEWDAEASLTQLQVVENSNQKEVNLLGAHCYGSIAALNGSFWQNGWASLETSRLNLMLDAERMPLISADTVDLFLTMQYQNQGDIHSYRYLAYNDALKILHTVNHFNEPADAAITGADLILDTAVGHTESLDGYIWGKMCTNTHSNLEAFGQIEAGTKYEFQGPLFYVPQGYRFVPKSTTPNRQDGVQPQWNLMSMMTWTYTTATDIYAYTWNHALAGGDPVIVAGTLTDNPHATSQHGKKFGQVGSAKWCPGPWAYEIDAGGIRNKQHDGYTRGGLLFDSNGEYQPVDCATGNYQWVAICPRSQFPTPGPGPGGAATNKWLHWRSEVPYPIGDGTAKNAPVHWPREAKDTVPAWGNGFQNVHISGKGTMGKYDTEVFQNKRTRVATQDKYGGVLGRDMTSVDERESNEHYRVKVLYEFGNCQYQFDAQGSPTRVLPNLVPIQ